MTWSKMPRWISPAIASTPVDASDFIWFEPAPSKPEAEWISAALVGITSSLAAAVQGLQTHGVALACIPIIIPFSSPADNVLSTMPYASERSLKLQKLLVSVTVAQGSLSLLQFVIGDTAGGLLGLVMACVGCYAAMPNGIKWLPSYIVMSFINGSIEMLGLGEKTFFGKYALFSLTNPLVVNIYHSLLIGGPLLCFVGVYFGYQLLKEIRLVARGTAAPMQATLLAPERAPGVIRPATFAPFSGTGHKLEEVTCAEKPKSSASRSTMLTTDV